MARDPVLGWVLASYLLLVGGACARASEGELLSGKACAQDEHCVTGFVCDISAFVCVPGSADVSATAGSGGATAGSAGASTGGSSNEAGSSSEAGGAGGSGGDGAKECDASCPACIDGACIPAWVPMSAAPSGFAARAQAAYAAGNGKLLIWGGADAEGLGLNSGAIYDPALDTWELVPVTPGTPSPRVLASAAWTGARFLIWGGRSSSGSTDYKDGALYDPIEQVWTKVKNSGAPRAAALTLGSAGQVLAWGGWSKNGSVLEKGERYAVAGNQWSPAANDPLAKREHVGWAINADSLYIIGGRDDAGTSLSDAFVYSMSPEGWASLPPLPEPRHGSFAVHDGATLWVWGGRDEASTRSDGLALSGSSWAPTSNEGAPDARWAPHRQSGWSCALDSGRFGVAGGHDGGGNPRLDGGVYDVAEDAWWPIPATSAAHEWGVGACIDGELLLWGGSTDGAVTASGERWSLP